MSSVKLLVGRQNGSPQRQQIGESDDSTQDSPAKPVCQPGSQETQAHAQVAQVRASRHPAGKASASGQEARTDEGHAQRPSEPRSASTRRPAAEASPAPITTASPVGFAVDVTHCGSASRAHGGWGGGRSSMSTEAKAQKACDEINSGYGRRLD